MSLRSCHRRFGVNFKVNPRFIQNRLKELESFVIIAAITNIHIFRYFNFPFVYRNINIYIHLYTHSDIYLYPLFKNLLNTLFCNVIVKIVIASCKKNSIFTPRVKYNRSLELYKEFIYKELKRNEWNAAT